jgi:uncharacterized protein YfaT (DUF1175 family)
VEARVESHLVASPRRQFAAALLAALVASHSLLAQIHFSDEADRAACRAWFVLLADAAYYRPVADVTDCAGLIRYALREALRPHTPDWLRRADLPLTPADIRERPAATARHLPLFRISSDPRAPYAEFADARTLVRYNTHFVARDPGALRPGDLIYYQQPTQRVPDHVMVFIGRSAFDHSATDFVVYHTGPTDDGGPGEVRKTRLADLERHPAARWRPVTPNRHFVGIFRLTL